MVDIPTAVYHWGWAIWGLYFIVLEALALMDPKQGDTLSENIRWIRAQAPELVGFMLAVLLTWLYYHFLFQRRVGGS